MEIAWMNKFETLLSEKQEIENNQKEYEETKKEDNIENMTHKDYKKMKYLDRLKSFESVYGYYNPTNIRIETNQ